MLSLLSLCVNPALSSFDRRLTQSVSPSSSSFYVVYDAPSLPPGMDKWKDYQHENNPWYLFPSLEMSDIVNRIVGGEPTSAPYFANDDEEDAYWWVPLGTTNITVGPWFPGGSSRTTLVKSTSRPPSPGSVVDVDRHFMCAIYDAKKEWMCYERVPLANQGATGVLARKVTQMCNLRWLMNVFLVKHQPTGTGMGDYPEWIIEKGVGCQDVGYFVGPLPDTTFKYMRAWNMLDPERPLSLIRSLWATHYPMALARGSLMNTLRYITYWKAIAEAWER